MHAAWKRVPPTGALEAGGVTRPTLESGFEPLELADILAPNIDIRRMAIFQSVWSTQVQHFVSGRLYLSVVSRPPPATMLWAELRAFGVVAGVQDLIVAGVASSSSGPLLVQFQPYTQSYVEIRVEARAIVNGVPSSVGNIPELSLTVAGRLFR